MSSRWLKAALAGALAYSFAVGGALAETKQPLPSVVAQKRTPRSALECDTRANNAGLLPFSQTRKNFVARCMRGL